MTDAQLIRAIQAGDTAALETLYQRYLPSVWRYACTRMVGDAAAAEDVASETFLAAVRQIGRLSPEGGSVGGWLIGIARHKIGDVRRRRRRLVAAVEAGYGREDSSRQAAPAAPLEAAETRTRVAGILDGLPDEQRMALEWKYVDDLSVREIAQRLGRTEKAAETVLYRARNAFRARYEQAERAAG